MPKLPMYFKKFSPLYILLILILVASIVVMAYFGSQEDDSIFSSGETTPYEYTFNTTDCVDSRWCNLPSNFPLRTRFVGPGGTGSGLNTNSPMSLNQAISESQPGDLIWLMEGTYTQDISMDGDDNGTEASPIIFRAANGKRVVLHGNVRLWNSSGTNNADHVWIWGLEITEPDCLGPEVSCTSDDDCDSPTLCCLGVNCPTEAPNKCYFPRTPVDTVPANCQNSGINMRGTNNRVINTHIYEVVANENISAWSGEPDQVIYGNILHHAGFPSIHAHWNHGIYTQNNPITDGHKYYINNAVFENKVNRLSYNFHAYTQAGVVGGMVLENNMFVGDRYFDRVANRWVLGGSNQLGGTSNASKEIYVNNNVIALGGLTIGYSAPIVSEVTNNMFFRAAPEYRYIWGDANFDEVDVNISRRSVAGDYLFNIFTGNHVLPTGTYNDRHIQAIATMTYNSNGTKTVVGTTPFARNKSTCDGEICSDTFANNTYYTNPGVIAPNQSATGAWANFISNITAANQDGLGGNWVNGIANWKTMTDARSSAPTNPNTGFFDITGSTLIPLPNAPWVVIEPNEYDVNRSRIFIGDGKFGSTYSFDLSQILDNGDSYAVYHADELFFENEELYDGTFNASSPLITLPLTNEGVGLFEVVKFNDIGDGGGECTPSCSENSCGDDGCGGTCVCSNGLYCGGSEMCVECTTDNHCAEGFSCSANECVEDPCVPNCSANNSCGNSDSCGGICTGDDGQCTDSNVCTDEGSCVQCDTDLDCDQHPNGSVCEGSSNLCVECTDDNDCDNGFNCNLGNFTCVADVCDPAANCTGLSCGDDDGCGGICSGSTYSCQDENQICTVSGTCVNCVTDLQCAMPGAPICDSTVNSCVECLNDGQCSSNQDEPYCKTASNSCVECMNTDQCTGYETCDTDDNVCIACVPNCSGVTSCGQSDGCGGICSGDDGNCASGLCSSGASCVECTSNSQCAGNQDEPYCKTASNSCVECLNDNQCGSYESCDTTQNTCLACVPDCSGSNSCGESDGCGGICAGSLNNCASGVCNDLGTCVGCTNDYHCSSGYLCNLSTYQCYPDPNPDASGDAPDGDDDDDTTDDDDEEDDSCVSSCVNKSCGESDGCGGSCVGSAISCPNGGACNDLGTCVECLSNLDCQSGYSCSASSTCVITGSSGTVDTPPAEVQSPIAQTTPVPENLSGLAVDEDYDPGIVDSIANDGLVNTANRLISDITVTPTNKGGVLGTIRSVIAQSASVVVEGTETTVGKIAFIVGSSSLVIMLGIAARLLIKLITKKPL